MTSLAAAPLVGAPAGAAPAYPVNPVVRAALYLFVLSIPFELPQRSLPLEVPTLTGFILLGATVLNPSACYRRVPAAVMCFVAYLWFLALGVLLNGVEHELHAFRLFITIGQLIMLFWVLGNLLADPRVLRGFLLTLVVACVARAGLQVIGLGATAHEVYTGGARVTAFGQNANLSAMILSAGLIAVVGLRLADDSRLPRLGLLTWPLAALLGMAIIQTGSRGGLLCAGVGVATFLVRGRTPWQRIRNGALAVLGVGLLAWGAYRSEVMRNRFEVAAEEGHLAGREVIYPALVEMFGERPLLGWGPIANQFEIARRIDERRAASRDAHNLVLELLTATGAIGAAPFLVGLLLCLRGAWRARRGRLGALPLALLLGVLAGTLTGTWIAAKVVWLALAFALGAGAYWAQTVPPQPAGIRPCAA